MNRKSRFFIYLIVAILVLALPVTALANKRMYKAIITTDAELHDVVGSTARGTGNFGTNQDGSLHFIISVRNLSGAPTAAHIHGPADATQNAGVVVALCGSASSVTGGPCPFADGVMTIEGDVSGSDVVGMTGGQFFAALNDGLTYFNVHTSLNPAGEARGQIIPR
jgi:hypothetical protein